MALINCPECLVEVSDSALKCVKCGILLRKSQRSFFGKLVKWAFILFNILMAWWLFAGMSTAIKMMEGANAGERAGAAIANSITATMIVGLWVFGDIILGLFVLFTRPKSQPNRRQQ